MNRRHFLGGILALSAQGMLVKASKTVLNNLSVQAAPVAKKGKFDDNKVVFISDIHTYPGHYQPELFVRTVNEILAMKPLPRNVIALGDLAYLTGKKEEYKLFKELIQPLKKAGITLTLGMGNHDRRDNFAEVLPEYAKKTLLKGRYVSIVETPKVDFIVLDTLDQGEDTKKWITPGTIDDEQKQWLIDTLKEYKKPVIVCAHHTLREVPIRDILMNSTCIGYINGHDHVWRPEWVKKNYSSRRIIPTLCLPSTGHWGDIGYMEMNMKETHAEASLHQFEYFFPTPLKEGESKPEEWTLIEQDHKNLKYHFSYKVER